MDFLLIDSWKVLLGTVLNTILAYVGIVLLLRFFGMRSLSKMNAFDFIVTVALGSTLATIALSKSVPLIEGLLAFVLLLSLQAMITWLSARSKWFKNLVTNQPVMLVYQGQVLHQVLKRERIAEEELWQAARKSGIGNTSEIAIAILETTGEIIIIQKIEAAHAQTLQDVKRPANTEIVPGKVD